MDKFIDYISHEKHLHPRVHELPFPKISNFNHLILYGPAGVGKYTQMLKLVHPYSPTHLKCEKKLQINTSSSFYIKMSDIHYEVDMDLIGCNSKSLWDDIYNHICDIIQNKYTDKHGIIVCKNFHKINHELLDIFYSYMQSSVKYILLTEAVSFLPNTVLSKCKILSLPRPSNALYQSCLQVPIPAVIHNLKSVIHQQEKFDSSKNICVKITHAILTLNFTMAELREDLYSILIFNLGVEKICWMLLTTLPNTHKIDMIKETIYFLQHFNNNYRPIYHLEKYIYSLITILHKL